MTPVMSLLRPRASNTTEAINAVMYSLLTQFRDGDNVVTTLMERIWTGPATT
jgi:hypothetical protein